MCCYYLYFKEIYTANLDFEVAKIYNIIKRGVITRNSKTTQELYEKLLEKQDLHSMPELDGEILIWNLYENAYIRVYCDSYDTCIDIISNSILTGSLTHWHPDEDDMFDELYSLGKKAISSSFKIRYY